MRYPSPGLLARATLSRWERDLPECFFQFEHHSLEQEGWRAARRDGRWIEELPVTPVLRATLLLLLQFIHSFCDRAQSFGRN